MSERVCLIDVDSMMESGNIADFAAEIREQMGAEL